MNKKVSVFCIWRDSEKTIDRTLKQLESLESLQNYEFSYYFYENDSEDNTKSVLGNWLIDRSGSFLSEKLSAKKFGSVPDPARMKFLCECRNKSKELAGDNESDYSLLIDSDVEFNNDNFLLQIKDLNNLDDAVMITPNVRQNVGDFVFAKSKDSYYDVYAFKDKHGGDGVYFSDCPSYIQEDRNSWENEEPIMVMSSFGGFALIKSNIFNKVSWDSDICCDHVNMCFDISKYGNIYCEPKSRVYVDLDLGKININSCKKIGYQQRDKYEKFYKKDL